MAKRAVRAESRARYQIRIEAERRNWNTAHVSRGGDFLEENEISAHFPDIGLGQDRPDFIVCNNGEPVAVIEAKNEVSKLQDAVSESVGYAESINSHGRYTLKIAVGAAGEEDRGFVVEVKYLLDGGWVPLTSNGFEITNIPSRREVELALASDDGTTSVTVPDESEFIDAAVELSRILRSAKIEAPLRPKVIGAIVLAMYKDDIETSSGDALDSINAFARAAINDSDDMSQETKDRLFDALRLSGSDFERLAPHIGRVVTILRKLNIRPVLQTDIDFLGMFYEAFLRYGYDNNALGIVFTPRHITRFCVDLLNTNATDKIIDIACGTGGFLVSAFDKMMFGGPSPAIVQQVKSSIYGFDTNPTVWALALLNMFFRGDGKSNIALGSCFDADNRRKVSGSFKKAYLNPPFSQDEEPERDFLDASMSALEPQGLMAAVVYAGIFADDRHQAWREQFLRRHSLQAMISLPEDLFYPTAAPTSIIVAKAHVPMGPDNRVLMARVWNDGFEKLKNRRIAAEGSQLPAIKDCFDKFQRSEDFESPICCTLKGVRLMSGEEWSPQQWLPQPPLSDEDAGMMQEAGARAIFQAVARFPELADEAIDGFPQVYSAFPEFPLGRRAPVSFFFDVVNGKSTGEKNYRDGSCPYVSSGDSSNSIIRPLSQVYDEVFPDGAITVTAFGQASIQPWPFMARGNGGSSVRVLLPKFKMTFKELAWFCAQINMQRWRFFYARMSIKSRIEKLEIKSPDANLPDEGDNISTKLNAFRNSLDAYSSCR